MRASALGFVLALTASLVPVAARATDQPIAGTRLVLQRSAMGEKLSFVSRDPAALFPVIGGPDDPATGTPGGLTIDLFSANEGTASLAVPGGSGWTVRDATVDLFRFRNPDAPAGTSVVKVVVLKQGRVVRVIAKSAGLPLATTQGQVGIRLTTGSARNCALFDAATVRRDEVGRFVARAALASALADCTDASLGGPTTPTSTTTSSTTSLACEATPFCTGNCSPGGVCAPTPSLDGCYCALPSSPCGETAPVCNGTCPAGDTCAAFAGYPLGTCGCIPSGDTACGGPFPACGGACPTGTTCVAGFLPPIAGGGGLCTCGLPGACGAGGSECPPGAACGFIPPTALCLPVLCTGGTPYPTCGDPCAGGLWVCQPFSVGGAFTGCDCAPP